MAVSWRLTPFRGVWQTGERPLRHVVAAGATRQAPGETALDSEQVAPDAGQAISLGEALWQESRQLLRLVVLFVVFFLVLKTYVIEGYEVEGASMTPTLQENDRILVFKLPQEISKAFPAFSIRPIEGGDVVVFDSPVESGKRYVKRAIVTGPPPRATNVVSASMIGPPPMGPRVVVQVRGGDVQANSRAVSAAMFPGDGLRVDETYEDVTLGPGDLYVLGDHRGVSRDSRSFGPVNAERVVGRAVLCFWPLDRIGWL